MTKQVSELDFVRTKIISVYGDSFFNLITAYLNFALNKSLMKKKSFFFRTLSLVQCLTFIIINATSLVGPIIVNLERFFDFSVRKLQHTSDNIVLGKLRG